MLNGNYQWFKNVGVNQVVIRHTVSGCDIPDGAQVLTWAQIEDPDTPGNIEGFYCNVAFSQTNASAMASADVETQTGTGLDYASYNDIQRRDWCNGEDDDCERQSVSQWQKLASDAPTNYPSEYETSSSTGSSTCAARRIQETP